MKARVSAVLMMAALGVLALGCGGRQGKPVPVEGKVTLEGNPLSGVSVQFVPVEGEGKTAIGVTGDDGSFRLTTTNTGDGAPPGEYKVVIKIAEGPIGGAGGPPMDMSKPQSMIEMQKKFREEQAKKRASGEQKKSVIHANYQDPAKTPLRQRVPPDGKVELKLTNAGS